MRAISARWLISAAFVSLLAAQAFGRACARLAAIRSAAILLLALVTAGNLAQVRRLMELGRGQYLAALDDIQSRTAGPVIDLASDHDFRNGMMLSFYANYLQKRINYHPAGQWPANGPEWLITHELDRQQPPLETRVLPNGVRYTRTGSYPYAGLSGWRWDVYRRSDRARNSAEANRD